MKAQSKITARGDEKSRSSARIHSSANIQQPQLASVQPAPAIRAQDMFTIEEHLRVQREIEERAHRFWFAKDCALKNALDDWLKAEAEVLAEFAKMLARRRQMQRDSNGTQTRMGGTSTLLPAVPYQSTGKVNMKSTVVFQHNL